jgi:hypothetical protein
MIVREFLDLWLTLCDQDFLVGPNTVSINENAISNVLVDIDFLDNQFKSIGRGHVSDVFNELRLVHFSILLCEMRIFNVFYTSTDNFDTHVKHRSRLPRTCHTTVVVFHRPAQTPAGIARQAC